MIEPILRGVEEAFENLAFDDETSVGLNNIDSEDSDDDDNSDDVQMGLPTIDNESQMPMGYNFSKNIIRNLKIRFCEIKEDKLYRKCTFLDPRYQDYFLTDDKVKDDIKKDIKEEIIAYKYSNNVFENEHETVAEPPVIKSTKFWGFMKQRRANREETILILRMILFIGGKKNQLNILSYQCWLDVICQFHLRLLRVRGCFLLLETL
ncbi:uncharacterized protein LOC128869348 [Anastrepha ludens]|uniref:uncharacterized protein LOC128869348 n=1 Tax=Anastrepha ludens TaxID=28586 RepID=UPI0023B19C4D|nr:uncharacterized protein LOC128869348 [Anastrepha ludens]